MLKTIGPLALKQRAVSLYSRPLNLANPGLAPAQKRGFRKGYWVFGKGIGILERVLGFWKGYWVFGKGIGF